MKKEDFVFNCGWKEQCNDRYSINERTNIVASRLKCINLSDQTLAMFSNIIFANIILKSELKYPSERDL